MGCRGWESVGAVFDGYFPQRDLNGPEEAEVTVTIRDGKLSVGWGP